jgi:hypothetical protein
MADKNTIILDEDKYNRLFSEKKYEIVNPKPLLKNFTIVLNEVFEDKSVYPSARLLYIFLLRLSFGKGVCYGSYDSLARRIGWNLKTIGDILNVLREAKWISTQRQGRGKPNRIVLKKYTL